MSWLEVPCLHWEAGAVHTYDSEAYHLMPLLLTAVANANLQTDRGHLSRTGCVRMCTYTGSSCLPENFCNYWKAVLHLAFLEGLSLETPLSGFRCQLH